MARLGADMPFPTMDSHLGQDWKAQHDKEAAALAPVADTMGEGGA